MLLQHYGVDVAAALGSFPSGGIETQGFVSADAGVQDVFRFDSFLDKNSAVGFRQVDMVAGLHVAFDPDAVPTVDGVHQEARIPERAGDLFPHLEASFTDAGADYCLEVLGLGPVFPAQRKYGLTENFCKSAAPPCVNRGHRPAHRIVKKYGDAVRSSYSDGYTGDIRDKRVIPFQLLARSARAIDYSDFAAMHLMCLHDRTGKYLPLTGGKRFNLNVYVIFNHILHFSI